MGLRRLAVAVVASVMLTTIAGQAQPPSESDAERLFEQGRSLFREKKFVEACVKLQESDAIEPSVGTHGLLAACHEQIGKLATARRQYMETAEMAQRAGDSREAYARERAEALDVRAPRLLVRRAEGVPPGATLSIDGLPRTAEQDVALDPGEHTVELRSADGRVWRAEVTLAERERATVILGPGGSEIARTPVQAKVGANAPPTKRPAAAHPSANGAGVRTAGFVALGVGAAAAVAAGVTGGVLLAKKNDLEDGCPEANGARACSPAGAEIRDEMAPLLVINAIAWGVAFAGAGVGVTLLIVGQPSNGGASAALRARF